MDTKVKELYRRLQVVLDEVMPIGFPATQSGVEIRLLEILFTPDDAHIATYLNAIPETAEKVWKRMQKAGETISLEVVKNTLHLLLGRTAGRTGTEKLLYHLHA